MRSTVILEAAAAAPAAAVAPAAAAEPPQGADAAAASSARRAQAQATPTPIYDEDLHGAPTMIIDIGRMRQRRALAHATDPARGRASRRRVAR